MRPSKILITEPTAGEGLSIAGGTYRIVLSGAQTGGAFAVIEMLVPPGGGPGPHAHAAMQESFYVLNGEVEFRSEAGTYTTAKGTTVTVPAGGAVYCFKNKTGTAAHLLCTVVPAGLDDFFREASGLAPSDPRVKEQFQALGAKYGQEFFPQDYLDK
jgi:quercetin dioxygenase-like cupin family protein